MWCFNYSSSQKYKWKQKQNKTKTGPCAEFCHHPASISIILIIPRLRYWFWCTSLLSEDYMRLSKKIKTKQNKKRSLRRFLSSSGQYFRNSHHSTALVLIFVYFFIVRRLIETLYETCYSKGVFWCQVKVSSFRKQISWPLICR